MQNLRRSLISLVCTCIGILALVAPALAQVNGPGPSPSSAFDIVANLPEDYKFVSGVNIPKGQTIQLNVSDGGTLGIAFEAIAGLEMNLSGGTVDRFFDARSGSESNISGGRTHQIPKLQKNGDCCLYMANFPTRLGIENSPQRLGSVPDTSREGVRLPRSGTKTRKRLKW